MAGRRLSSNDVSVVIALAIVVIVLLLIIIVERGAEQADEVDGPRAVGARADAEAAAAPPFIGSPSGDARVPATSDSCGLATFQPGAGQPEDEGTRRQRDEAMQAILAVLDVHPDPRARAAGLYFRAARDRVDTRAAEVCRERPSECSASEQRHRDERGSTEALARLAVDSADPQVYAWAHRSCAALTRDAAGSCQLINALQWARLDPGNAEPWLAVGREARTRRDAAGLDDAMFHVAAASVHDAGWGRATAQMIEAAPKEDRMIAGTWLVSLDAIGYETVELATPDMSRYCDARAVANANRRDTCEKIAALLVDRSTTLMGRAVGIGLGKRLDWPSARFATVEQERDAAYAVELREAPSAGEPLGCDSVRRELSRLLEVARLGEVEALRRRVAATGEPITVLAAEGRQAARLAQDAEAARAAASAAVAAVAASPYSSAPPPAR